MKVLLAKTYGFCWGVKRAIEIALNEKMKNEKLSIPKEKQRSLFIPKEKQQGLFVLKEIVHNPQVVADLGIKSVKNISEVPNFSSIIFSAHGVAPTIFAQAKKKALRVIDATCPLVTKVHILVKNLVKRGYQVIYVGDPDHDEVIGVVGEVPDKIKVIRTKEEAQNLKFGGAQKLALVTQTTLSIADTSEIIEYLKTKFPKILIFNTICDATTQRQKAVMELARKVKTIIVIGGRKSSNTQRLKEVAEENGAKAYQIEKAEEINKIPFDGIRMVGVTAGASTPEKVILEVVRKIKNLS